MAKKLAVVAVVADLISIDYCFYDIRCFEYRGFAAIPAVDGIDYLQQIMHIGQTRLLFRPRVIE